MLARICFSLAVSISVLLQSSAAYAQTTETKPQPTFAVGEKVEVWWAGKYLPGEIVAVEEKGWVQVKFTRDGREQTIKQRADGEWVRKLAAPKPIPAPAPAPAPAATPPASSTSRPASSAPRPGRKPAEAPAEGNPFATPEEAAMRTWSDSTGKFKIEARFAGKDGDSVLLTRADGKTIKLPLARLSQADQDFVTGLAAKPMTENPFEAAPEVAAAGGIDREADYSTTESVIPQPADGWSLVPDAATAAALPPRAVGLASGGNGNDRFFETAGNLFFDAAKGQAIAVLINGRPGQGREVRFIRADLAAGKVAGEFRLETSFTPVDLSPSGDLVACLSENSAKNEAEKNRIAIFRLDQNGLAPVIRWKLGEGIEFGKKFERLHFVSEDKLLAVAPFGGTATLFDIAQARALWSLKIVGQCPIALSANRAQFAAAIDGGIGIFSTANAETLGRISTPPIDGGVLSISPNGKRLAHCTSAAIHTWDLTTGQPLHEVWFPHSLLAKSVDWITDTMALVDREHLVDLEKRIILWHYELPSGAQPISRQFSGRVWLLTGGHNHPFQLFSATLPDPAATAKAQGLTADGVLALKPGSQVSLKLDLARAKPEDAQKARDALAKSLADQGMTVAEGAPLVLEATIVDRGKEKVSYRSGPGFFGRGGQEVEVQKEESTVALKENGKVLWSATRHYGAPHLLQHKPGQTLEQAIQEQRGNPADYFLTVKVPKYLARHEQNGCYGSSKLAP